MFATSTWYGDAGVWCALYFTMERLINKVTKSHPTFVASLPSTGLLCDTMHHTLGNNHQSINDITWLHHHTFNSMVHIWLGIFQVSNGRNPTRCYITPSVISCGTHSSSMQFITIISPSKCCDKYIWY